MINSPDNSSERELLINLKLGAQGAFDLLYHQNKASIYGNLLKLVKSEEIAEELLQEVFIRIWEKKHLIDPEKPVAPYLYRIARNLVMDFYRKAAYNSRLKEYKYPLQNLAAGSMQMLTQWIYVDFPVLTWSRLFI